jgi:hypothetical protein
MTRVAALLIVPFLVLPTAASGQFLLSADAGAMYDDNIDNNLLQQKDRIALLSLDAGYDWETDRSLTELFYSGSLNYYTTIVSRSMTYHTAGLKYSHTSGEEGTTQWNAGLSVNLRSNRNDYSFYDHTQLQASTNVRHAAAPSFLLRAGYTLRSLAFRELPDFNYNEHYGFAQATAFLPTSTTLIVEADLGFKRYTTANADTALSAGSGGTGRTGTSAASPSVLQAVLVGRIGQSIAEGTGVSLTFQYQTSLQKESRYLASSYGMISDDDLFDDHYAYDGLQGSLMLTQLIGESTTLRLTAGWQDRHYTSRPAYDVQDSVIAPLRDDQRMFLSAFVEHYVEALGVSIGFSYDHIVNRSNDPYFHYSNDAAAVRFSVPLLRGDTP